MKKIYIEKSGIINVAYKQTDGTYKYVPTDVNEGQIIYYSSIEKTTKSGVQIGNKIVYNYTIYVNSVNGRFIIPMGLINLSKSGLTKEGTPQEGKDNGQGNGQGNGSGLGIGFGTGLLNPWLALGLLYVILK